MNEITLQLNEQCNLSCKYCFAGNKGKGEINIADLKYFTDFCKINNIESIHITGGEPTLFSSFKSCIEEFAKFAYIVVYSNFTLPDTISSLDLHNPDVIFLVNINHPEEYNTIQWNTLWDNVAEAKRKGIRLAFGHTFHRDSIQSDFEYVLNLNKKNGIRLLRLSHAISNNSLNTSFLSLAKVNELYRYVAQRITDLNGSGIKCYFDCPLPPCWIDPDIYTSLRQNIIIPAKCDPKVFISYDLSIHHCYIEPQGLPTKSLRDFSNYDEVREYSTQRTLLHMRKLPSGCLSCPHTGSLFGCACPYEGSYRYKNSLESEE